MRLLAPGNTNPTGNANKMSLIVPIVTLWLSFCRITRAQSDYSPCPILGPRYPRPIQISQSEPIQEALSNLTAALDELNISGNGSYTQTTPESTTYSIALFDSSDITQDSPFFYQYHHVAPSYVNTSILDADSIYNIAGLSPLVTVYAALSILDEHQWHDTVTKYLPQLNTVATGSAIQNVNWSDVRLIDLATHLSGLGREGKLGFNATVTIANSLQQHWTTFQRRSSRISQDYCR